MSWQFKSQVFKIVNQKGMVDKSVKYNKFARESKKRHL